MGVRVGYAARVQPQPDIRVTVRTLHLPQHSRPDRTVFAYFVRIENHADLTYRLMRRFWRVMDGRGAVTEVEGEGVVGETPLLAPGGVFEYDSLVTIEVPPGRMSGHYEFQDAWGERLNVPIPEFMLDAGGGARDRVLN